MSDRTRLITTDFVYKECSRTQEAIWFAEQAYEIDAANNLPVVLRLEGELDLRALNRALTAVVQSQPALRTTFAQQGGRLARAEAATAAVEPFDVRVEDVDDAADAAIELRSRTPIDLLEAPYNVSLLRQARERHVLVAVFHHAIFDGTSKDVFIADLASAYRSAAAGDEPQIADHESYDGYVAFEKEGMARLEDAARAYWEPALNEIRDALEFPSSPHRDSEDVSRGESLRFRIDVMQRDRLAAVAKHHNVSLFLLLVAAVQTLQYRYAGTSGTAATAIPLGTRASSMAGDVGLFVNEVPLHSQVGPDLRFSRLLEQIRRRSGSLFKLRLFPFTEAVARFAPQDDPRTFAPRVGLSYRRGEESDPEMGDLRANADRLAAVYGQRWAARFRILDSRRGLTSCLEYDSSVLHDTAATRMVEHFRTLLDGIAARPAARLSELPLLGKGERKQILVDWNATDVEYPRDTIQQIIEAQVARTPDRPAAVFHDQQITYQEVNARANALAHRLIKLGSGPGTTVAICVERSLEMLVAVLGTMKSGAAFLPLDPLYPPDRISLMMQDSDVTVLVTQTSLADPRALTAEDVVYVDSEKPESGECTANPELRVAPEDIAYIIFTSGSTGRPKGAELLHGGLSNLVRTMASAPGISARDVFLAITTLSFDIGSVELLAPLTVGAKVAIAPAGAAANGAQLKEVLDRSGATMMFGTPTTWRSAVDAGWRGPQKVIIGGEALSPELASALLARTPEVWNIYGPTETTIFSTVGRVEDPNAITIGRPVANTQAYIVDGGGELAPIGIAGELCIGGAGVTRGYRNRPDLTSERYIAPPFAAGGKLYKTGDLVRYRDDGAIEFIGRIDHQVKIRGNRIEPGEIESALLALAGVRQAAVVAREDHPGVKRLVAYIVLQPGPSPTTRELRDGLSKTLHDVMIPSAFVLLEALPINPNGKLDRVRLPEPGDRPALDSPYTPPRNDVEEALAEIWKRALGVDQVGIHDNFFELGGHSVLAAEVVTRAAQSLRRDVPLRLLFISGTIAKMASSLSSEEASTIENIPRARRRRMRVLRS